MRYLYNLILYLLAPFILLRLLWRAKQSPDYAGRIGERFGFVSKPAKPGGIWIHAVSVGEVIAAVPLIKNFMQRFPNEQVIVTTMTPTGSERVQAAFGNNVFHSYAPYDFPFAMRRFLKTIQPRIAVIMETELWPNLLAICKNRNIPVYIANARLSERSVAGYKFFPRFAREMMNNITLLAAQAEADAGRFVTLGLAKDRLRVTGSIKFDLEIPPGLIAEGWQLRQQWGETRPVWIAASTHAGEDEQVLTAFTELRKQLPELVLILVPRHPERFARVAALCQKQGYRICKRSDAKIDSNLDIFLGDTMGELLLFYTAADVAFVGGSLVATGGHNVLEPAALGMPVVTGPHMFNFAEISEQLQQAKALYMINEGQQLATQVAYLLQNATLRQQAGEQGKQVVINHKGALQRQVDLMVELYTEFA